MTRLTVITVLLFAFSVSANADIWKWVDAYGNTHFVDSDTPIYTWVDEYGKVHYSDKPEHESAVSVELVWHSTGSLDAVDSGAAQADKAPAKYIDPNETEADRYEREQAEAYYCKRAQEIYDSYINAPRLYSTDADGNKVYLNEEEKAAMIADTEAKVAQLCN